MFEVSENVLRTQVLTAQRDLEAVRAAIAANEVTRAEGKYVFQVAFQRYCAALRRFSDVTVYGTVAQN
jgi:hypothetical protein